MKTLVVFYSMWGSKDGSTKSGDVWIILPEGKKLFTSISSARDYATAQGCCIKTRCV